MSSLREGEASRITLVFKPEHLTERREGKYRIVERSQKFFLDMGSVRFFLPTDVEK